MFLKANNFSSVNSSSPRLINFRIADSRFASLLFPITLADNIPNVLSFVIVKELFCFSAKLDPFKGKEKFELECAIVAIVENNELRPPPNLSNVRRFSKAVIKSAVYGYSKKIKKSSNCIKN